MVQQQTADSKGFFAALFDFSLTSFITLKFLKLIYVVITIVVGLATLVVFIALASRGGAGVVIGLIVAPIAGLIYLILARIYIELIAVLFRIGESTSAIAAAMSPGGGLPPASLGYGGPPPSAPGPGPAPSPGYGYGAPPPGA